MAPRHQIQALQQMLHKLGLARIRHAKLCKRAAIAAVDCSRRRYSCICSSS